MLIPPSPVDTHEELLGLVIDSLSDPQIGPSHLSGPAAFPVAVQGKWHVPDVPAVLVDPRRSRISG